MVFRPALVATALVIASLASLGLTAQAPATDFDSKMSDADSLLARRQWEDALRIYKAANGLKDKKSPHAQIGMARAYQGLKAHKSAADACTEALKYVGEDKALEAAARNVRGISLFSLAEKPDDKRWKQAEEDFRAVMRMTSVYPVAQYNLGVTLLKQNRDAEGIAELTAYIERAGRAPEAVTAKKYVENPRRARENFAPDFSFATLTGEFLSSEDLKGKVVLLDFWATWCAPCIAATPGLKKVQNKFKDDPFVIVGVSADRDQTPWRAFVEEHKLPWAQFYDDRRMMANRFQVNSYPTYILIDHEGIIQYRQAGWSPRVDGEIEGEARSLIRKAKALQ
ncbi:MAG TPA: redoxin domain-containing protein [Vicinamibacterales bacterium]|nr:redoxin domain-containing protein [Vicinamibacterales bacterium]